MATIQQALELALDHHRAGRLREAETIYLRVLQAQPQHAGALHLLGVVAYQTGHHDRAIELTRQATDLSPDVAEFHDSLGGAYQAAGKLDHAMHSFQRALQLNPNNAKFHYDLGNAHKAIGNLEAAVQCFQQAVRLQPQFVEALNNLGGTLGALQRLDEAVTILRQLVQIRPDYGLGYSSLGSALHKQGELDEAVRCHHEAVRLQPNDPVTHTNLGATLKAVGQVDQAMACYRRALQIDPRHVVARKNLASCMLQLRDYEQAIACYRTALEIAPDDSEIYCDIGRAYAELGRVDLARESFETAQRIRPNLPLWDVQIATIAPKVFRNQEEIDQYRQELHRVLRSNSGCGLDLDLADLPAWASIPPFVLLTHGRDERPLRESFADVYRGCFAVTVPPPPSGGRPRIGFVVTRDHESIFLRLMGGVLQRVQPELFDLVVVCARSAAPEVRNQLRNTPVEILVIPDRFDRIVETLRAARFHVLYHWEVGTDVMNYFLPYFRLAPVQLTSWGVQVTSGIPEMDYYLSSKFLETDQADKHYTERLLRAETMLSFQSRAALPAPCRARADYGFAASQHVYLCAQRPNKLHPSFDRLLAEILRSDDSGVVAITESGYEHDARLLRDRFRNAMPDVAERIVLVPKLDYPDYLGLIAAADVLLDPLHYGGVTTTYDALSLNKPIVTLPGDYQTSRYTYSCYSRMGVTDCVAGDTGSYVEIALALGKDGAYRKHVEERLARTTPRLFEDEEVVREYERIFAELADEARQATQV